ncbi:MAG: histidine kinase [Burkholderia sp.]|jgi:two-component system, LuxR family, sensor histidine kinase TtrS
MMKAILGRPAAGGRHSAKIPKKRLTAPHPPGPLCMTPLLLKRAAAALLSLCAAAALAAEAAPGEPPTLRIAIVKFVRPAPNEEIVDDTLAALRRYFGAERVKVTYPSLLGLREAIEEGSVDVFLSSAGFYWRMSPYGVRDLATAVSDAYPDPNRSDGTAMIVKAGRSDLKDLPDLKGKVLVTSTPSAFTGRLVPFGEIYRAGYRPETFFGRTIYLGDGRAMARAPEALLSGEADVAFMRLCFYEELLERRPELKGRLAVIHRLDRPEDAEPCRRSTELYPTWTVATTPKTPPQVSRLVTRVLLEMPPSRRDGLYWGVVTDYSALDRLFRDLKEGPYAYMKQFTMRRFLSENWRPIALVLLLMLGLAMHSVRVTQIVRERTASLRKALKVQKELGERERIASDRLAHMEKASVVSQLSVIFAHEMRQPLGAISLYSFALKKLLGADPIDREKAEGVLKKLDEQTARADGIVTRVRAYAKSEEPRRVPVSLLKTTEKALSELEGTRRWKAAVELSAEADPQVLADPLEAELIALNLVKNALQALEPLGTAGRVWVRVSEEEKQAVLTVSDNGEGVTDDFAASLNRSFASTKPEGLGLGLSIVRGILERHRGHIAFARAASGGLAARVTMPLLAPGEGAGPASGKDSANPPQQTKGGQP